MFDSLEVKVLQLSDYLGTFGVEFSFVTQAEITSVETDDTGFGGDAVNRQKSVMSGEW